MVQVPDVSAVMVLPLTVQTACVVLVKVTGVKPLSEVADTVPVAPTAMLGAAPKVMACVPAPMMMFCVLLAAL